MDPTLLVLSAALLLVAPAAARAAQEGLSADDLVRMTLESNPQVKAARAQYEAALHQIDQAYAPQDPEVSWTNSGSPTGFRHPTTKTFGVGESFQFPGKAWLQGDEAHRAAEIARLSYEAAVRDARAQTLAAYYQTLLDRASLDIALENAASTAQVLQVVEVSYSANQAAQSDLIGAELALAQSSQTAQVSLVARDNDEAALNQLLGRDPEAPLTLTGDLELQTFEVPLQELKTKALAMRQEILSAALSEKNAKTALKLAWMELLPDLNASYARNRYVLPSAPPSGDNAATPTDNTVSLGFNVPVFFWFKQKEDARSAARLLEAARQNRKSVEDQTLTSVVQLYRTTKLARQTALLNKNLLIPLAYQNFRVSLVAYQSKKVDFMTVSSALQGIYTSRTNYLAAVNQFLAGKAALEQAIGAPIE